MNSKDHFLQMFNYDHWANRECLAALSGATPVPAKVVRLLTHVYAAQQVWLERLEQVPQSVAVWPDSTAEECSGWADEMLTAWKNYLAGLSPAGFENEITYRNSKGEQWSSRVDDILIHVLMHSAYHRGQAALEMRAAGLTPAYTDFIHGVRQGLVG